MAREATLSTYIQVTFFLLGVQLGLKKERRSWWPGHF